MSTQGDFFHSGTAEKLKAISGYLSAYQSVLKSFCANGGRTTYFDAFAGTGDLPIGIEGGGLLKDVEELSVIADGSARRALMVEPWFDRYVFVERSLKKATELAKIKEDFPLQSERISVIRGDANDEVTKFCRRTDWAKTRAVMFLDPFGNQVNWETIAAIARCPIDLWYLFPAHLGINRQVSNSGIIEDEKAASLDRVLGTSDWRAQFLFAEIVPQLDGSKREVMRKQLNADIATRFMIARMKSIFKGGVVDGWLPLGPNGAHWYSLVFAWGNSSQAAGAIAKRIAEHLMTRR